MKSCPKCNGTGKDAPLDLNAPRGSLENPFTMEEAIAHGIDVEAAQDSAEEVDMIDVIGCKLCGGIGWI